MLPMLLLPGMDGTGELFAPFVRAAPAQFQPIVVPLPDLASYDELWNALVQRMPAEGSFAILGESFSGPLALRLAERSEDRVVAVILCNSFVDAPRTKALRFLPWRLLFSIPPPEWAIRRFLAGNEASATLIKDVQRVARICGAKTFARRLAAVFALNTSSLRIKCPVLDLRGADDRLVPRSCADRVAELIPHAERVGIPGPHQLLQTHPAAAWTAITTRIPTPLSSSPDPPAR